MSRVTLISGFYIIGNPVELSTTLTPTLTFYIPLIMNDVYP